jgi:hypothetical protein
MEKLVVVCGGVANCCVACGVRKRSPGFGIDNSSDTCFYSGSYTYTYAYANSNTNSNTHSNADG